MLYRWWSWNINRFNSIYSTIPFSDSLFITKVFFIAYAANDDFTSQFLNQWTNIVCINSDTSDTKEILRISHSCINIILIYFIDIICYNDNNIKTKYTCLIYNVSMAFMRWVERSCKCCSNHDLQSSSNCFLFPMLNNISSAIVARSFIVD